MKDRVGGGVSGWGGGGAGVSEFSSFPIMNPKKK